MAENNVSLPPSKDPTHNDGEQKGGAHGTNGAAWNNVTNTDNGPAPDLSSRKGASPWHFGLCECCGECSACMEACCCSCFQISRQYNMLENGRRGTHWPICVLTCLFGIANCLCVMHTRELARRRYGIKGSACGDCCVAWCCGCCAVQQQYLEMASMGDNPGGVCVDGDGPKGTPRAAHMQ